MARIDRPTSHFLDAIRWMAALAVVLSHVAALVVVDDNQVTQPGLALRTLFYLKNTGHLAVVVFFVLSGYLVGGQSLLRVVEGRRFDAGRYAIQRFSRIYTVLVPALLLTLALDTAGRTWFDAAALYTAPAAQHVGSLMYAIAGRDDALTFLGNLFMLQTVLVEPFGGDGPLWSLANEWWYYVVFGLVLVSASPHHGMAWRIAAGAAGVLILAVLPSSITWWSLLWLLGAAAAVLGQRWRGIGFGAALLVMSAGFGLSLLGMYWGGALVGLPKPLENAARLGIDAVAGLAFCVALVSARNAPARGSGRVHQALASFSYTIYAIHFPLVVFLGAAAYALFGFRFGQPLGPAAIGAVAALTATIAALAWAVAFVTERRTPLVRDGLAALLRPRSANAGAGRP